MVHKFVKKVSNLLNIIMPFVLVIFAIVIIINLIFTEFQETYKYYFDVLEWCILIVFILDLIFKYFHYKHLHKTTWEFVKHYFFEILSVIPVFFVIRAIKLIRLVRLLKFQRMFLGVRRIEKYVHKKVKKHIQYKMHPFGKEMVFNK